MKHRARKRFGQNFLVDQAVIRQMIRCLAPQPGELIIEIGPGQGALTRPLLESGAEVRAIEIDRDLAALLSQRHPELEITNEDVLRVDFSDLAKSRPYRLVGNLPYNISTPLLFHVFAQRRPPVDMQFMLQKEVVDRMGAGPGSREYGRLSLACQNHAQVNRLLDVPPEAFNPQPRIQSAVVRLTPRNAPLVPESVQQSFDTLVKTAFGQRRKTLRNSLKGMLEAGELESAGVDGQSRPEQLHLEQFLALATLLVKKTPG